MRKIETRFRKPSSTWFTPFKTFSRLETKVFQKSICYLNGEKVVLSDDEDFLYNINIARDCCRFFELKGKESVFSLFLQYTTSYYIKNESFRATCIRLAARTSAFALIRAERERRGDEDDLYAHNFCEMPSLRFESFVESRIRKVAKPWQRTLLTLGACESLLTNSRNCCR